MKTKPQLLLVTLCALFLASFATPAYGVGYYINSVTGPANGTYQTGQQLIFTVSYTTTVTVTGRPQLALTIGATARYVRQLCLR
jgi:hypothetical protein